MKKIFKQIALIVLTIVSFNSHAQVTGCYVPSYQQSQSNWCWAACGEMIYWSYEPGSISQCTFVNRSRDREQIWWGWWGCDNLSHSSTSACSSPSTFNSPQSMYGCDGSLSDVLDYYGIGSASYSSNLSGSTLTSNLSDKKLMIARWGWNNGGGHFVVINRYKNGYVYFNNPSNGSANTWTWSTFNTANGSGSWTSTLRMNHSANYGTTYYRNADNSTKNDETVQSISVNCYPNPASDKINIVLNGEWNSDNHITIADAVGKVMLNQNYSNETTSIALDVASWSRGVYFLNVNGDPKLSRTISLR